MDLRVVLRSLFVGTAVIWVLVPTPHAATPGTITAAAPGYIDQWGSNGFGNGEFIFPVGVAVDTLGKIFVADREGHRIQKFDSAGTYLAKWGNFGSGNGEFSFPAGVAVDCSGNVYVVDTGNNRIQKFDSAGSYVSQWGSTGSGNGQFMIPAAVAVDCSGNVYVADSLDRIQQFDSQGNYLTQWGSTGSGNGQFDGPAGVAVDSSGNVYVADRDNDRIQKFDSTGVFLANWGGSGSGSGQFSSPDGVAVDSSGNVYVVDTDNDRLQKFDSTGNYLSQWGSSGNGDGQFTFPEGVAVDPSGNVYVADTDNHRIQKFASELLLNLAGFRSEVRVERLAPTVTTSPLFTLRNKGGSSFRLINSVNGNSWFFAQNTTGDFLFSRNNTGGPELKLFGNGRLSVGPGAATVFDLFPNGNLDIEGDVTAASFTPVSSREVKESHGPADPVVVLEQLGGLPIHFWSRKADSEGATHLGPMAEDFHGAFGLGRDEKRINLLDAAGVALASIQGLHRLFLAQERDQLELEQQLGANEQRLQRQHQDLKAAQDRITALEDRLKRGKTRKAASQKTGSKHQQ